MKMFIKIGDTQVNLDKVEFIRQEQGKVTISFPDHFEEIETNEAVILTDK